MQAESATAAQIELQQRALEMEAKAVELDRMLEGLQNELDGRTAELREEVCCLCWTMRTLSLLSFSLSTDHAKACDWALRNSSWRVSAWIAEAP